MKILATTALLALAITGCTVGPRYQRPAVDLPAAHRGIELENAGHTDVASLADQKWWEIFQDPQLQQLERTAIEHNYDVRIAAARILEAQAQLGIVRSNQFPHASAGAFDNVQRNPAVPRLPVATNGSAEQLTLSAAWELDFWGKFRRATEASRANLLASEWARRQVISTLVSNVATAYFQLRELDLELEISKETLASRQDSLKLTQLLADRGSISMLDVRQAEQLVYTAGEQAPNLERRIAQQENLISTLVGSNPEPVLRGLKLTEQPHAPQVPAGLPSSLLERRPDIRQAEQQMVAFNAQIGVAKAAYFPQITLTGDAGFQSAALTSLFSGPAGLFSLGGSLMQPIFNGGRTRSAVKLTEAQKEEAVLFYRQTIQQAFRDVSDSLVAYEKNQEFRQQQQLLTNAAQDASHLSDIRYKGGAASYLEVLTNQTNYFSAQLNLAQAQLNELDALVQLYRSLGGGWEQP
ncbi:MAG TPA: efflux transporter outer membrane subunit [Candidatus Saccharimonadales bacterium]|jgi:multidrug efflux system outer membrane protein|nr:efflux transporter outer membrane subunit [Candidatus Saccharimonadales bacterium]